MKVRNKNKKERGYDLLLLEAARTKFLDAASEFSSEFEEMDGDIYHSTFRKFNETNWMYCNQKEVSGMDKVGDEWDYSKGITGIYRYRNI